MFNTHNQTQRLIDSAMVHCLYNYPAGYTSHHLHRYKVHLPTFLHVNLASVYLSKAAAEAHLTTEDSTIMLSDKKGAAKFIVLIIFFKVFTCVCICGCMCVHFIGAEG